MKTARPTDRSPRAASDDTASALTVLNTGKIYARKASATEIRKSLQVTPAEVRDATRALHVAIVGRSGRPATRATARKASKTRARAGAARKTAKR